MTMAVQWNLMTLVIVLFSSSKAIALPEYSRFGYFNCTSCHASPTGGGVLTPYGRAISAELVTTWQREGEEQPLHGAVELPPSLILGGNLRFLQLHIENDQVKRGRIIGMQKDLEIGVQKNGWWLIGTVGFEGTEKAERRLFSRRYFIRYDASENIILRTGRFHPKFGLMVPNHFAAVRQQLGFDQGTETDNAELTILTRSYELILTAIGGRRFASERKGRAAVDGGSLSLTKLVGESHRVGISALWDTSRSVYRQGVQNTIGYNGVYKLGSDWFLLSEIDLAMLQQASDVQKIERRRLLSYHRIGFETTPGIQPYLQHETDIPDLRKRDHRTDTVGLGLQLHPRPHFEFDLFIGTVLDRAAYSYNDLGWVAFHYYL